MTQAELEWRGEDAYAASRFLGQARRFLTDAQRAENATESRAILVHQAALSACDAFLAIEGYAVNGSEGGHRLRLTECRERIPLEAALFERLDDSMQSRHEVSYQAATPPGESLDEALDAARELLALVGPRIEARLPDYFKEQGS